MSISANFPHQLALLLVALQTDKLPVCEQLQDPTEKSLFASLLTYLNNRDFRTPITIARKTLGMQIRVKRSTLFNKLRSLKEKGLIEDVTGELPIRFTEKAIALIQLDWTKQADRWKETQREKKPTFKVGHSTFPAELLKLINRGISEKQLRALLSEAKKAGTRIQDVLRNFETSLSRYDGKILFLVIRDILRKPKKYLKTDKKPVQPAATSPGKDSQHSGLLRVALDNAECILDSGECLKQQEDRLIYAHKENNYQNIEIDSKGMDILMRRMRAAVLRHVSEYPDWCVASQAGGLMRLNAEACADKEQAVMMLENGRQLLGTWHVLYAALPPSARQVCFEQPRDSRLGRQLIRRGISYLVDSIHTGVCALRVLSGQQAGKVCTVPEAALADPEISWQRT